VIEDHVDEETRGELLRERLLRHDAAELTPDGFNCFRALYVESAGMRNMQYSVTVDAHCWPLMLTSRTLDTAEHALQYWLATAPTLATASHAMTATDARVCL
jgi:hypothetical protein